MNVLVNIVPVKYRKYAIYAPVAAMALVLGVAGLVSDASWIDDWSKAFNFVTAGLGLTAFANAVPTGTEGLDPPLDEAA